MARRKDENQIAFAGLQEIIRRDAQRDGITLPPAEPEPKDPKAVKAGKLGGKARAKTLTPRKRKNIAKKAANARWKKSNQKS